jgi:hypothetical protein
MKIIITEDQLKTTVFQNAVDMALEDIKKKCNNMNDFGADAEEIISFDVCDQLESIKRIEIVTAYKTNNIIEMGLIVYKDSIFSSTDDGDYLYELEYHLREFLGKGNFKLKLLNVINENSRSDW